MNKEFIPDEQALELKELGFDEYCFMVYYVGNCALAKLDGLPIGIKNSELNNTKISAPLYQQAFRWFREKYNIQSYIDPNQIQNQIETKKWFTYWIGDMDNQNYFHCYNSQHDSLKITFNTYEEAELACLKKLIEIVKNDGKD